MDRQGLSPEWTSFLRMLEALDRAAYQVAFRSGPNWYGAVAYFLEALEDKEPDSNRQKELLEAVQDGISYRLKEGHWL